MTERSRIDLADRTDGPRDEWSMRLVEYLMAALALAAVALIAAR